MDGSAKHGWSDFGKLRTRLNALFLIFLLEVPYQDNYAISQWLGISLNLLLAEIMIARINTSQKTVSLKSHHYEIS